MTEVLEIKPSADKVKSGVKGAEKVAPALSDVLADTYRLIFKTHAYHWNVTGPLFYSIHKLTDEQYENMFTAADEIAERIRALGQLAPHRMDDIVNRSEISDRDELPSARVMVEDLAKDHETVANRLHQVIELAGNHNDPVTEDLATERSAFHEECAWMLRAIAAD